MGWGGGYDIYCRMTSTIDRIEADVTQKKILVKELIMALEDQDWDGLGDMDIEDEHKYVQEVIYELHPNWDDYGGAM